MRNIKKKFENETKIRINMIGSVNSGKLNLQRMLVKQGIFDGISFRDDEYFTIFPTEILCSSPRSNSIRVYLSIKKEEEILKEIKDDILKAIYEAYIICKNYNEEREENEFKNAFNYIMHQFKGGSLNKFYDVDDTEEVFGTVEFNELFNELKIINYTKDEDLLENKDDSIWEKYFKEFQIKFKENYYKCMKMISEYYAENNEGYEYINEQLSFEKKYSNKKFDGLCEILYGTKSSCTLMIERAYIEAPSSNEKYSGSIYIDYYTECTQYEDIVKNLEKRIIEDYKELFLVIVNSKEEIEYFSKLKDDVNKITLDKRIFCILNEFNFYRDKLLKDNNNKENLLAELMSNMSTDIGISQDKIIVTEQFHDIDKNSLKKLNTNNDFLNLLRLIKAESEKMAKPIKIKSSSKEKLISISLNQERMSVQALMGMLYERYHGYLVDSWKKIIENEEMGKDGKKYFYSEIHTIIGNRKYNYREYKNIPKVNIRSNYRKPIDFSLKSGDYNDSKKIFKMLVNYGYNTVGFDSTVNKILVKVNGEISKEDTDSLLKSIRGRLEESAIDYFESAFFMNISRKKFNTNSLYKALESEKNITVDDFYNAFNEMFKKMSDNIVRYEVHLQ